MARIKNLLSYPKDERITVNDYLIGSDGDESGKTRNYPVGQVLAAFNEENGLGIFNYRFSLSDSSLIDENGRFVSNGANTSPYSINELSFSKLDVNEKEFRILLESLSNNAEKVLIRLADNSPEGKTAIFKITSFAEESDRFRLGVLVYGTLSTITFVNNGYYTFSYFLFNVLAGGGGGVSNTSELTNDGEDGINPFIIDSDININAAVVLNTAKTTNATHTGDATGDVALTITNKVVTNAKLSDMASNTLKGRLGTLGSPQDLTATEVRTMLNIVDGANNYSPTSLLVDYGFTDNSTDWDTAFGWGNHAGLYEVIDLTILRDADINVTVQPYNVNTTVQGVITLISLGGTNDHTFLSNIGVKTHVEIDTHLDDSTIHFIEDPNWDTAYSWGDHFGLYADTTHNHIVNEIIDFPTTVEAYITDPTAIGLLEDIANWNASGVYTGTAIAGTFQGQKHVDSSLTSIYFFEATDDDVWVRLLREEHPDVIQAFITDPTAIGLLENLANWDIDGVYTGTAITSTFQGQRHYDTAYFFEAVDDNSWVRYPRA